MSDGLPPSYGQRFYEALRSADPIEFPDEWADLTPTWHERMESAARTYDAPQTLPTIRRKD